MTVATSLLPPPAVLISLLANTSCRFLHYTIQVTTSEENFLFVDEMLSFCTTKTFAIQMKDDAIVCNIGHFDCEIQVKL